MLCIEDYNKLLPFKDEILKFKQTGHYKGDILPMIDLLRQKLHIAPPINYGCEACKVEAMKDALNLLIEYESKLN